MNDILQDAIDKIAAEAEANGIELSSEELAQAAYEKLAQESEEGESEEHEAAESEEKEEGEQEEGEEEAEKKAFLEAAVEKAAELLPEDADPEDIAKAAYDILENFEEKTAAPKLKKKVPGALSQLGRYVKRHPVRAAGYGALIGGAGMGGAYLAKRLLEKEKKGSAVSLLEKIGQTRGDAEETASAIDEKQRKRGLRTLRHAGIGAAGGAALGAGLGAAFRRRMARRLGVSPRAAVEMAALAGGQLGLLGGALHGGLSKMPKEGSFETAVVKRARMKLAMAGFDPDTGKPMSKVAMARTPEEAVEAGALELLESKGWPVSWDPNYLARGVKG
ncbi:MAG: hypothetical protein GYA36_19850 [Veillonellaceae bacterium]|nr:hypothetical protein [Veillonellaceae bacterium]